MKAFILLLAISAVFAVNFPSKDILTKRKFEQFKQKYNKSYESPQEELRRFQIFKVLYIYPSIVNIKGIND